MPRGCSSSRAQPDTLTRWSTPARRTRNAIAPQGYAAEDGDKRFTLLVALLRGDSWPREADRRALDVIATPLALALHATTLSEEIRATRAAAVELAAAEQVRLQRELHDRLGPTLTSVAYRADAESNPVGTDTEHAA